MKRLILYLIYVILLSPITLSQTTFLGIPIPNTKPEMVKKLKTNGFVENKKELWLEGIYEGKESIVLLITNDMDTVVQVDLIYKNWTDNIRAKMIFTHLYYTFQSDIYYKEISFKDNNQMYEALFYQVNSNGTRNGTVELKMIHGNGNKYTIGIFFYCK